MNNIEIVGNYVLLLYPGMLLCVYNDVTAKCTVQGYGLRTGTVLTLLPIMYVEFEKIT